MRFSAHPRRVYDDMPHDLVLFSMANSANYAYRAIASFCKAVTTPEEERLPKSLEPIHELDPNAVGRNDPLKEPQAALYQHGRILSPPSQRKLTPEQGHALQSTIYSPLHPFHVSEEVSMYYSTGRKSDSDCTSGNTVLKSLHLPAPGVRGQYDQGTSRNRRHD